MPPNRAAREALGTNLREARTQAGVSQERLAHESGISRSYVSHIERGLANLALDHLVRLAEIIGVEPGDLVPTTRQISAASRRLPRGR